MDTTGIRQTAAASVSTAVLAALMTTATITTAQAAPSAECERLAWQGSDSVGSFREIYTTDPTGAALVPISNVPDSISTTAIDPAWSADGARLAHAGFVDIDLQIIVSDAAGGSQVAISDVDTATTPPTNNDTPQWSPDGTKIAWVGFDGATTQIYVAENDGTSRIELSTVDAGTDPTDNLEPRWSPDGSRIAWQGAAGGTSQIFVADADGTNRTDITTPLTVTDNTNPDWSPDGSQLAWSGIASGQISADIYVADADGNDASRISLVASDHSVVANGSPAWSPTGERIAWDALVDVTEREIVIADADGANRIVVSNVGADPDPTDNGAVDWSPAGDAIAWVGIFGGVDRLFTADADGSDRVEISASSSETPQDARQPTWQPRTSNVFLSATTTGGDDPGDLVEVVVSVSSECPASNILISGIETLSCLDAPSISFNDGFPTAEGWLIESLGAGGVATAEISGSASDREGCANSATLESVVPANAGNQSISYGQPANCNFAAAGFTDIAGSFAATDIACILGLRITSGTTSTTYDPASAVTREQMAAFLARLWRSLDQNCDVDPGPLTDIAGSFAAADIGCILDIGVTSGVTPTMYDPGGTVTREQMAAFLARLWRALGGTCSNDPGSLTDIAGSFAAADIGCILDIGITTGITETTYAPGGTVTREQMAAFLARFWRKAVGEFLQL